MRLSLIPPDQLTPEQKPLYDDMKAGIESNFNAFRTSSDEGALIGPWNAWLHEPEIGGAIWSLTKAMTAQASLPDPVRQIAILVVGAHFNAGYELYAHIAVAEREGMGEARLSTLVAGGRPADLSDQEGCAYDVAYALCGGGVLPEPCYRRAVALFGQHGANELIYLVGLYCLVSTTLNGFDVPVPEPAETDMNQETTGVVEKAVKRATKVKVHTAKATAAEPEVVVKGAKSGKKAAHKPEALKRP